MKQTYLFAIALCSSILFAGAQTKIPLVTLPEGSNIGDGTYLGVSSYSTHPCWAKSFALEHHFYGITNSSINFFRGCDAHDGFLTFNTNNNTERMRIDASGKIGIGTTNPLYKLSVNGLLGPGNNTRADGGHGGIDFTDNGIGYSQAAKIYTFRSINTGEYYGLTNDYDGTAAQLSLIAKHSLGNICFYTGDQINAKMKITSSGNVGIGVVSPQHKLDVKGTICANEVLVKTVDWADFVFDKNYKLRDLKEVDQYIQDNGHLPEIPSAKDVKNNGMSLVEMQVKLLQKVEEMTLYILKQQKEIETLRERVSELQNDKIK